MQNLIKINLKYSAYTELKHAQVVITVILSSFTLLGVFTKL